MFFSYLRGDSMRICFVCQSLDTFGGVQRAVALLANELASRGEDVSVLMDGPRLRLNPYGLSRKVHVLDVGIGGPSKPFGKLVSKIRRYFGYPRPIQRTHDLDGSVIDGGSFSKVRTALFDEGFDVVVGCDPLHTIICSYACDGLKTRVCGWQHSTYDGYFGQRGKGLYGFDRLYAHALASCEVNFVLTERSRVDYERRTGYSAAVLPNSIVEVGERSTASDCILYCGRLDPGSKGADFIPLIAEGLAALDFSGKFFVVGDGPYRSELEKWLARSDLPFDLELKGFVSDTECYYTQASVLISPSRWEGFGLSILEGMSHGVPCVAFDNDGPRSLISDGVDGVIVPNGDVDAMVGSAIALINNGVEHERLAAAAIETSKGYLVGTQADRFLAALEGWTL